MCKEAQKWIIGCDFTETLISTTLSGVDGAAAVLFET